MAINPLIAMGAQVPDVGQTFGNALTNVNAFNTLRENMQTSGLRKEAALSEADQARIKSAAITAGQIVPMLQSNDIEGARSALTKRRDQLKKLGLDSSDLDEGLVILDENPSLLLEHANQAIQLATMFDKSGKPAGLIEFETMTKGLTPEDTEKSRRIALGLEPRAVGSAAITTATTGLTDQVAGSEAAIAGAKAGSSRNAELDAELEKLPDVKAAVTAAEERIKNEVEAEANTKKNSIAYNTYRTAIGGLVKGLEATETGPAAGRLPAISADAQIADGAVSAMATILKSIFRQSGEGTFTDQDQKLLIDMVPTRKDHPAARVAKINNINAIIQAKLGLQNTVTAAPQTETNIGRFKVRVK